MSEALRKSRVPGLLAFGVLMAVMAFGCSQNGGVGGGDQTSESRTSADRTSGARTAATGGTTTQETTAQETTDQQQPTDQTTTDQQGEGAQQQNNAQQNQGGGQVEITVPQQGQQQGQQQQRGEQRTVTVRITGTEGLSFSGRVGSAQDLRRVQGTVPEEYEIPFGGAAVTATLRKQQPGGGTLGAEVVRGGEVVASRETSTRTGVVNVVWTPQGQGN